MHLLHVVPDAWLQAWAYEAPGIDVAAINDDAMAHAQRRLEALIVQDLPADRVRGVVRLGAAGAEITRCARDNHASLLVLGTHGYGAVPVPDGERRGTRRPRCAVPGRHRAAPAFSR